MKNKHSSYEGLFSKENITILVISTLLAFLFGKFLDPLFTYFYSSLLNAGGIVIKQISDSTYKQISNGFSEQPSMFSFYLLCMLSWAFFSHTLTLLRDSYKQLIDKYKKYNDILEMVNTPLDDTLSLSGSVQSTSENNPDLLSKEVTARIHKVKIEYRLINLFFIILYILLIFTYSRSLYINTKITSITNNIEIVSPYISDIEYKQLKSNFHTMENSEDYYNLMSTLSDIAKDYSIVLKK